VSYLLRETPSPVYSTPITISSSVSNIFRLYFAYERNASICISLGFPINHSSTHVAFIWFLAGPKLTTLEDPMYSRITRSGKSIFCFYEVPSRWKRMKLGYQESNSRRSISVLLPCLELPRPDFAFVNATYLSDFSPSWSISMATLLCHCLLATARLCFSLPLLLNISEVIIILPLHHRIWSICNFGGGSISIGRALSRELYISTRCNPNTSHRTFHQYIHHNNIQCSPFRIAGSTRYNGIW